MSSSPAVEPADAVPPGRLLAEWLLGSVGAPARSPRHLRLADGQVVRLDVDRWAGPVDAADETLLSRAVGPVLDLGCGPGRLAAALHVRGVEVLGVDALPGVPVLARQVGAPVHVGDVFGPLPAEGSWQTVLLADGNVGIGGDPARLFERAQALLAPGGAVLCELHPDSEFGSGRARLEGHGRRSAWFRWTLLGPDDVGPAAARAGLRVAEQWSAGGRVFAALV